MNRKMTTKSQLLTTEPKTKTQTKQTTKQEQNHRSGDHMEGYQWESRWGEGGGKVQGISNINGR